MISVQAIDKNNSEQQHLHSLHISAHLCTRSPCKILTRGLLARSLYKFPIRDLLARSPMRSLHKLPARALRKVLARSMYENSCQDLCM